MILRSLLASMLSLALFAQTPRNNAAPAARPVTAGAGNAILLFTPWRDPKEGAFTLNVPQGWQIGGGTVRDSSIDPRHILPATSPDGGIQILMGDNSLIPREVPNQGLVYAGMREGQVTRRAEFAQPYIRGTLCRQAQITSFGTLADATRQLNQQAIAYGRSMGSSAQASVGEAGFRCGSQIGYVRASTVVGGSANGAQVWGVLELSGFIVTNPGQALFARYILNNIVSSLQMDQQWLAHQAQLTKDV